MARAEFGSNELPVGWFAFCSFWREVLIVALTAGWGRARDRAPGLECSSLLRNLFFLALEACNTACCKLEGRRSALDLAAQPWEGCGNGDPSLQPGTITYGTTPRLPSHL